MAESTAGNEPVHLNNHHRDTLSAVFAHPTGHNIQWIDVLSLATAVGDVEEKHDGKFRITIGGAVEVFSKPRHKDIDVEQVLDFRRMFKLAGYTAEQPGKEI